MSDTDQEKLEMILKSDAWFEANRQVLGSKVWIETNRQALLNLFPEILTHQENIDTEQMDLQMEKMGIINKCQEEFDFTINFLEKIKIFKRTNLYLIRRNNHFNVFDHVE